MRYFAPRAPTRRVILTGMARVPAAAALVLVVEDDWLQRQTLIGALQFAGLKVVEAATAEEAMRLLENSLSIDILITDISLPGDTTGWDIAEAYRAVLPEIPVIYASASRNNDERRVPGSIFFSKPYQATEVVEAAYRAACPDA